MITEKDLIEAIAECQGERNPSANTCIKLAAFYTIKNELFPKDDPVPREVPGYSYESREDPGVLRYEGDSNFARMIDGMETEKFCRIMEELVESLQIIEPRLYAAVIRKFRE